MLLTFKIRHSIMLIDYDIFQLSEKAICLIKQKREKKKCWERDLLSRNIRVA